MTLRLLLSIAVMALYVLAATAVCLAWAIEPAFPEERSYAYPH